MRGEGERGRGEGGKGRGREGEVDQIANFKISRIARQ